MFGHVTMRAVVLAGFLTAGAGAAFADSYGAISLAPGSGATGWSHGYASRWEAEDMAQANCAQYADDCRVAIWFKNACGAVARGPDGGWGSSWASSRRSAQNAAVKSCQKHSYDCQIVRWQCSGAQ